MSKLDFVDDHELIYGAVINGRSISAFLDSGASHIFMSPEAANYCGLQISSTYPTEVTLGDGSIVQSKGKTSTLLVLDGVISDEDIYLLPLSNKDQVVVGRNWLRRHNPDVDWRSRALTITREDGSKHKILPKDTRKIPRVSFQDDILQAHGNSS